MAVKPMYAAGLDVGSRTTRLVVCLLEDGRLRLLGCASAGSQGWNRGCIADQRAVTESVIEVMREVEVQAGISLESVTVGVGGPTVRGANGRGVLDLNHQREIEQRDVNHVVARASRVQLQEDRMVLQLFPQDFVVDDHPGHRNPRGMMASRLEINVHLVTCSVLEHTALVGAVNQAHLKVEESVFEALAACYASVLPEDRREGIAAIDIGAHSTELVVYYGDAMYLASVVRVCGDHFTRDLAQGLCLSFEEAETVKLEYGGARAQGTPANVWMELPSRDNRDRREAQRRMANQILEARARELFELTRNELARVGMEHALIGGVVLTGGGALLPDLCDVAEQVLQCQARFGLPIGIRGWPDELCDPAWATAAGLSMYSARLKMKTEQEKQHVGLLGRMCR